MPQKELNIDFTEIDSIVFAETKKVAQKKKSSVVAKQRAAAAQAAAPHSEYVTSLAAAGVNGSVNQSRSSIKPYEEEESYENPVNISRAPGCQDEYVDIRSDYANAVNMSLGGINASQDEAIIQISNL